MDSEGQVRILWALSGGFILGIFARSLMPLGMAYGWFFVLVALACMAASWSGNAKRGTVVACAFLACGLGIMRMDNAVLISDPVLDAKLGARVVLTGVISAEPDVRETQVRVAIDAESVASTTALVAARVLAVLPAHTPVYYGQHVQVIGTLALPETFDAGAGRQFDYPGYLAAQGILYQLDLAQLEGGEGFSGNRFIASAIGIKRAFVSGLERALPEPQSGLAAGITAGDKRALGKDLTQEFMTVSLVHIVVLSGYNITIVIAALFRLLASAPRTVRFGAAGLVAIFFAMMTGFASASLRAALMALIAISGEASGRIYRPERALAVAALGMLAWNPYLLVFDPGFQLSFLATLGLIVFSPACTAWFARVPEWFGLREILVSTSSAQAAVLPLLLYASGNLSIVSLPANLLALAAVPPAMLASFVAALGGLTLGPIGVLVGFPAYVLLSYVLGVAHMLAQIPYASVTLPAFSAWLLAPAYAVIFGMAYRWKSKAAPGGAAERTRA